MSCQYPNCFNSIYSICTNHCHWSLCQEHLNEHKNCLIIEFENVLEDLIKPTNQLSKSIEQTKKTLTKNQEKQILNLKETYKKNLNFIEQQLNELNKYEKEFNQISEYLNQIKQNQNLLKQNHFQQIENLFKEINQYENSLTNFQSQSLKSNVEIIEVNNKQPCLFYNKTDINGIHSKSCLTMVTKRFLPIHLKTIHRLRGPQIQQVLQLD